MGGSITHKLAALSAFQLAPGQFPYLPMDRLDEARSHINSRIRHAHWQLKSFVETIPDTLQTAHSHGILGLLREKLKKSSHLPCLDVAGSKPDHLKGFESHRCIKSGPLAQQVDKVNAELTSKILNAFSKPGWVPVTQKDGIEVWKRDASDIETGSFPQGVGPRKSGKGKFLCVRARGIIDANINEVYRLFQTNDYVLEYNSMCQECIDVGWLDPSTKLTWASSKRIGPILPRDFVTRCHYRRLRDGTIVLATMSEPLPCEEFRQGGEYCRMDVTLGGYLLRPIDHGTRTEFSMLSLANPGGVLDSQVGAMISNMVCATGPITFISSVRSLTARLKGEIA
ncbi:hypothetical protein GUITHDRAFT_106846 [Guillardia theta CCMP2712]|uniref:START domain-containing protein n=2 Tax=Guillardia theta TaxID=55529 RepID=L1JFW2_GUITC|nr:hypothetical protein GUITHDRAFT_106846 [Guillardia theta CCMP2712]EKX47403.1 hypothetical protein GUITHDRAFT_106846 [Guillardia theta CCMP2712]|eukprot:XP_005834383.1 hypothetical protein GUITHDRAFT_106846 [Guillardia theta CCMP2712]